jgi:predicted nucleotidyltransferase
MKMKQIVEVDMLNTRIHFEQLTKILRQYPIQRALVFGSVLRDDFAPNSDLDMLIEYLPDAHVTLLDMSALQRELCAVVGRNVDLGTVTSLTPMMRERVLQTAQVIYERAG